MDITCITFTTKTLIYTNIHYNIHRASDLPVGWSCCCCCCIFPGESKDDDDDDPHRGGHSPHDPQHPPLVRAAGHQAAHQVHVFLQLADSDESGKECQYGWGNGSFNHCTVRESTETVSLTIWWHFFSNIYTLSRHSVYHCTAILRKYISLTELYIAVYVKWIINLTSDTIKVPRHQILLLRLIITESQAGCTAYCLYHTTVYLPWPSILLT